MSVAPLDDGTPVSTLYIDTPVTNDARYQMCGLRASFYRLSEALYLKAGKCHELLYWDRNTQYCGVCGAPMEMKTDISKRCTNCGKEVWPQLATAIIVLIHRGEEVLLVHARNFKGDFYGLVAGFVETGENLEEAVRREVMEETGLTIKNIRYFGSQPWPYPCGLMVGFNADYESGEVRLQREELNKGAWFTKDHLPWMTGWRTHNAIFTLKQKDQTGGFSNPVWSFFFCLPKSNYAFSTAPAAAGRNRTTMSRPRPR